MLKKICSIALFFCCFHANAQRFRDASLPAEQRVQDLLQNLTLQEKISLLGYNSKPVERLNIPAYNWWNEALHGVARAGEATVFPQAIGMAASFDDSLLYRAATAISNEARAKYNLASAQGRHIQYMGLTFWSPNINIFRDPRWGRGQETYGEDPFLTAAMGTAYVRGMQGNDPLHLKTAACAKHFAVHSGPEAERHTFDAIVDEKDLRETYLYAFNKLVNAGVEAVMCAYNRVNEEPCCTSNTLLRNILLNEWKFKGHIVTDCGALYDIFQHHKTENNPAAVAADAIKAGVSLDCSDLLQKNVMKAIDKKLLTEKEIDEALFKTLSTQIKLGFYDRAKNEPYNYFGADSVHTAYNISLARKMAAESMVLLKNDKNILPLDKKKIGSIMVAGTNAGSLDAMIANYHGMSGNIVTYAEGITKAAGPGVAVQYDLGSDYTDTTHFGGVWAAGESDVTIAVIGLTPVLEGEEGDAFLAANGGDRKTLEIPAPHIAYLKKLHRSGKPVIAVITAGSAVNIKAIEPYADAIIFAWYSGEQGGNALADILFGKISPSGRLPVTFYNSLTDLPDYTAYALKGRTYRYYTGQVQYPFGFGLSYTNFNYQWKEKPNAALSNKDTLKFTVEISNTGNYSADEVVQAYIQYPEIERMPVKELKAFKRINVAKNGSASVQLSIPAKELMKWDLQKHNWILYPGKYKLVIGSNSIDEKLNSFFVVK
ncbi:MAG: glycoside hydrolase family 3 C-terminal domain-containing protein [Chitinophagaceae bacterium]|jgi:beta-glucosidase|nr:glycoside hydrolase family 3 C-terminal domain-containing protein [Chitinophagaceae bacterium]